MVLSHAFYNALQDEHVQDTADAMARGNVFATKDGQATTARSASRTSTGRRRAQTGARRRGHARAMDGARGPASAHA